MYKFRKTKKGAIIREPLSIQQKEKNQEFSLKIRSKRLGLDEKPPEIQKHLAVLSDESAPQKKLIARLLLQGYDPFTIASMTNTTLGKVRKMIKEDPDFQACVLDLEEEFFGAVEKKQSYVMMKALERLERLIDDPIADIAFRAIDRIFLINGKYVQRFEDATPLSKKFAPEIADKLLTKGIKFLEMSREREKVTACSIDNSNTIDISGE